ncbi:MAG: CHASE domain-containing protein, partial [Chloroflexi bacterium]|nr:CHASE domain-containing protein [Chloroflexota bacterium]
NRGIYTMALRDGQILFGPENYPEDDPLASPPGAVYQEPGPEDFALLQTGRVIMAVGVDILAEDWVAGIHRVYWQALWASLPLLLFAGWFIAVRVWRRRSSAKPWLPSSYFEAIFVAACGLYLTGLAALLGEEGERLGRQRLFQQLAQTRLAYVRAMVESAQRDLASLARYFETSEYVNRQEFARFAGDLVRSGAAESYLWAPIVPAEERASFEEAIRREGLADFAIWERGAQWEPSPASPREVYYPVSYAEPMPEGDLNLGYDLGSEPLRWAALEEALRTGLPTASAPLILLHGSQKEPGILIVQPVSSGGRQGTGLVAGVLRLQGLLEHAMHLHQEVPSWLGVGLVKAEPPQGMAVLAVYPREHLADLPT